MGKTIFGLNLANTNPSIDIVRPPARVAIFGLASDYGCQLQITNVEEHLLEVLGMFELVYWQLVSSQHVPDDYDIAVVEGAVCTEEDVQLAREIRKTAKVVIAIGACAVTGGIPGLAADDPQERIQEVYGQIPVPAARSVTPRPLSDVIDVDFEVFGCPIEPADFVATLQRALLGGFARDKQATLCGTCRLNENECFIQQGTLCLGLVTRSGCGARCVAEGGPCTGCRGMSEHANIPSARAIVTEAGIDPEAFDTCLEVFNTVALNDDRG